MGRKRYSSEHIIIELRKVEVLSLHDKIFP